MAKGRFVSRFSIAADPEMIPIYQDMAKKEGMTFSSWVRELLDAEVGRSLVRQHRKKQLGSQPSS